MNASIKNAIWMFAILVTLAVSGWYFASDSTRYRLDEEALTVTIDNRVRNLEVKKFDVSGKMVHRLTTPYMIHIPKDNTNILTQPRILVIEGKQAPWHIRAAQGTSLYGGKKIILEKHVVMEQATGEKGGVNRFVTESIDYYPDKKFAETPKHILYQQPGSSIESIGMRAWLDNKHVQLLSKTRGRYEPART